MQWLDSSTGEWIGTYTVLAVPNDESAFFQLRALAGSEGELHRRSVNEGKNSSFSCWSLSELRLISTP